MKRGRKEEEGRREEGGRRDGGRDGGGKKQEGRMMVKIKGQYIGLTVSSSSQWPVHIWCRGPEG